MSKTQRKRSKFTPGCCVPVSLELADLLPAAQYAVSENPANAPPALGCAGIGKLKPSHLAVLTSAYWSAKGVDLSVGFLEQISSEVRDRILSHMNAWGEFANTRFRWTQGSTRADVRITREGQGYWSYLGTQIRQIPANRPTMCLQGFSARTPESEYRRVVRHETGHTLGFPHEHMRPELIALLDDAKVIDYFKRTQGWNESTTRQQVLTPLDESKLIATQSADAISIMTYQLPGEITRSGEPVLGGMDLSAADKEFVAKLYPKSTDPNPPAGNLRVELVIDPGSRKVISAVVAA